MEDAAIAWMGQGGSQLLPRFGVPRLSFRAFLLPLFGWGHSCDDRTMGFYFFFIKKCTGVFRTLDAYMDIIIRVQGSSMSDSTAKSLRLPKYIQHMASYEKKHVNETCKLTNFGYMMMIPSE